MSDFTWVVLASAVALAGLVVLIAVKVRAAQQNKARAIELQHWVKEQGYSFSADEPDLAQSYPALPFAADHRRRPRFRNVVRGRLAGLPLTAFDYSYKELPGRDSDNATIYLQVLAVEVAPGWPAVRVSVRDFGTKLALAFGGQDLKIGDDAFDRAFRVRAADEAGARKLLAPMAPALLARTDQEFWVEGTTVLALRPGTLDPTNLESWLGHLNAALALASQNR